MGNRMQSFLNNILQNSAVMSNPISRNAIGMYQQGNEKELKQLAENMCRENGTTIDQMRKQLRI